MYKAERITAGAEMKLGCATPFGIAHPNEESDSRRGATTPERLQHLVQVFRDADFVVEEVF